MGDREVLDTLPTIENTPLNADDDWTDVVDALENLKAHWKDIGRKLRISAAKLDEIEDNHPKSSSQCMNDMVLEWLNKNYNTDRFGEPTWRKLAEAIWKLNRDVFRKVAKEHKIVGGGAPRPIDVGGGGGMVTTSMLRSRSEKEKESLVDFQPQQRPSMAKLGLVKSRNPDGSVKKRVRLMDTVANKWRDIGQQMKIDEAALEGLEYQYAKNTDRINAVFYMFMSNGAPDYQFTWDGVIEMLEDVGGFDNLVKDFKQTLLES